MKKLVLIAAIGLMAQFVDGGLGMAYGVTSSTLFLLLGASPALASASVHMAEIGTTLMSGAAHWRFGNVDKGVLWRIALPGALGAFAGATVLSGLDARTARPVVGAILLVLGLYVLARFTVAGVSTRRLGHEHSRGFLPVLGATAGFVDAVGGGGWGPIGTPALLAAGRMEPRRVVGTVNAAEFAVTVAASLGFLLALGHEGIPYAWVAALLAGGAVAAPVAAWIVARVAPRILGVAVGGLIVFTNTLSLASGDARVPALTLVVLGWVACLGYVIRQERLGGVADPAPLAVEEVTSKG